MKRSRGTFCQMPGCVNNIIKGRIVCKEHWNQKINFTSSLISVCAVCEHNWFAMSDTFGERLTCPECGKMLGLVVIINMHNPSEFTLIPTRTREIIIPESISKLVQQERYEQDVQWGGPEHDDKHSWDDWLSFILYQLYHAHKSDLKKKGFEERLVKIAALAIAALEAMERKSE